MNEDLILGLYQKGGFDQKGTLDKFKEDLLSSPELRKGIFDKLGLGEKGTYDQFEKDLAITSPQVIEPLIKYQNGPVGVARPAVMANPGADDERLKDFYAKDQARDKLADAVLTPGAASRDNMKPAEAVQKAMVDVGKLQDSEAEIKAAQLLNRQEDVLTAAKTIYATEADKKKSAYSKNPQIAEVEFGNEALDHFSDNAHLIADRSRERLKIIHADKYSPGEIDKAVNTYGALVIMGRLEDAKAFIKKYPELEGDQNLLNVVNANQKLRETSKARTHLAVNNPEWQKYQQKKQATQEATDAVAETPGMIGGQIKFGLNAKASIMNFLGRWTKDFAGVPDGLLKYASPAGMVANAMGLIGDSGPGMRDAGRAMMDFNPKSSDYQGRAIEQYKKVKDYDVVYDGDKISYIRDKNGYIVQPDEEKMKAIKAEAEGKEFKKRFNAKPFAGQTTDVILDMAPIIAITAATGGAGTALGMSAGAARNVGVVVGSMLQTRGDIMDQMLLHPDISKTEAEMYTLAIGTGIGLISLINPIEARVLSKGVPGIVAGNAGKLLSKSMTKGQLAWNITKDVGTALGAEPFEEIVQEYFQYGATKAIDDAQQGYGNFRDNKPPTGDDLLEIGLVSAAVGLLGGAGDIRFSRNAFVDEALDRALAKPKIMEEYLAGQKDGAESITDPEKKQAALDHIARIQDRWDSLKTNIASVRGLKAADRGKLATLIVDSNALESELGGLTNGQLIAAKKAEIKDVNDQIKEIITPTAVPAIPAVAADGDPEDARRLATKNGLGLLTDDGVETEIDYFEEGQDIEDKTGSGKIVKTHKNSDETVHAIDIKYDDGEVKRVNVFRKTPMETGIKVVGKKEAASGFTSTVTTEKENPSLKGKAFIDVFDHKGEKVGTIGVLTDTGIHESEDGKKYASISGISTTENFRGKGFGIELYRQAFANLKKLGFDGLYSSDDEVVDKVKVNKIRKKLETLSLGNGEYLYLGVKSDSKKDPPPPPPAAAGAVVETKPKAKPEDIEAKKTDIEKSRTKELNEVPIAEAGKAEGWNKFQNNVTHALGPINFNSPEYAKIYAAIPDFNSTGSRNDKQSFTIAELYHQDKLANRDTDLTRAVEEILSKAETREGLIKNINVKYDAELAALKTDKTKEEFVASTPTQITNDQTRQLLDLGYSKADVNVMKPEEAHEIIKAGKTKPKAKASSNVSLIKTPSAEIISALNALPTFQEKLKWLKDNGLLHPITINGKTVDAVDFYDRVVVMMRIGNVNMPFYISTGQAGKKNVKAGNWYAFFGLSDDGWLNKGSEEEINNHYGFPVLAKIAKILNEGVGKISLQQDNGRIQPGFQYLLDENIDEFNAQMNVASKPANNDGSKRVYEHRNAVLNEINNQAKSITDENIKGEAEKPGQKDNAKGDAKGKSSDGKKPKTIRRGRSAKQRREARSKRYNGALNTYVGADPDGIVMQYLLENNIHADVIRDLYGIKLGNKKEETIQGEVQNRLSLVDNKTSTAKTLDELAHEIWSDIPEELNVDISKIKDAIANVLQDFNSREKMEKAIIERFVEKTVDDEIAWLIKSGDDKFANFHTLSYLDQLSEEEIQAIADDESDFENSPEYEEYMLGDEVADIESEDDTEEEDTGPPPKGKYSSDTDGGERLSNFKQGDIVYRNYNGRYQEFEIVDARKDIWKLKDTTTGVISPWNAANNGGFFDLSKDDGAVVDDVEDVEPEGVNIEEEPEEIPPVVVTKAAKRKIRDEKLDAADDEDFALLKKQLKNPNKLTIGGIDPEAVATASRIVARRVQMGVYKFSDIIEDLYAKMGEDLKEFFDALKSAYGSYINLQATDEEAEQMDQNIRNFTYESLTDKFREDVSDQPRDSSGDSQRRPDRTPGGKRNISGQDGRGGRGTGDENQDQDKPKDKQPTDRQGSGPLLTPPLGQQADLFLHPEVTKPEFTENSTGNIDGRGDSFTGAKGSTTNGTGSASVDQGTKAAAKTFDERTRLAVIEQEKVEGVEVIPADEDNIRETLPVLLPEQQDDVIKAEQRFYGNEHKTDAKAHGKGFMFTNGTGSGKAQPLDSKILTNTGWKLMGDISIGDMVATVDGSFTKVTGVFPQGTRNVYEITFNDGSKARSCDEHLWKVRSNRGRGWSVKPLFEISTKGRNFIPIASAVKFPHKQTKIDPYLMGVLLGDGNFTSVTTSITSIDEEIINECKAVSGDAFLTRINNGDGCPAFKISEIRGKNNGSFKKYAFNEELERLELRFKGSGDKFVPKDYLINSVETRISMLQGLLDTDGTVSGKGKSPEFTTISKQLADDVIFITQSLGGTARLRSKIPHFTHKGVYKEGRLAYTVTLNLPAGIAPFRLTRKKALYTHNEKYKPSRCIRAIEFVAHEPVQCISVAHESRLYLTDDCVVTHNTYTALGIAKRFEKQGKKDILIVTPSQAKVEDWKEDGKNMLMDVTPIVDTKDGGNGTVVTTFANFRANEALLAKDWDLIIYDESHRIMEAKAGKESSTTAVHQSIGNMNESEALHRLQKVHPLWKKEAALNNKMREIIGNKKLSYSERSAEIKKIDDLLAPIYAAQAPLRPSMLARARAAVDKTKVVFLSATPFKEHKNLEYANGFLFDYGTEEITNNRGSRVSAKARFYLENFGSAWQWKNHKLTVQENINPDAVAMQEVEFSEKLRAEGVLSGRAIESEKDYSREFPLVTSFNSEEFNKAFTDIFNHENGTFDLLRDAGRKVFFNYQYTVPLFESLKASMSIDRIKKHLDLDRKAVIFHRRREGDVRPPFESVYNTAIFDANAVLALPTSAEKDKEKALLRIDQAEAFKRKYESLFEYEQTLDYRPAAEQFESAFPGAVGFINGSETKKNKNQAIKAFNTDGSHIKLLVVQEDAGKEGISLHDKTGKHQRVLLNLSMPISTTTALQIEGRIYRLGQESDAIFEYPLLGLDLEIAHFGQNLNRRLSTTENLAMGEQSRDLIRSFAEGVLFHSSTDDPNLEQGAGGKDYDRKTASTKSPFRKAMDVYSTNQKTRGRRDQREGVDYYATPEPLGQKMVEWADIRPGDHVMEPSAGHGSIAMWFPTESTATSIEPSFELFSKLAGRAAGGTRRLLNQTFEDHNIINKYDAIVMNPPFGSGGKTAMDHIEKAFKHLREGGRIVALIPVGQMDKRMEQFLYGEDEKGRQNNPDAHLVKEIILPPSTFEKAGTSVNTRIVIIDKVSPKGEVPDNEGSFDLRRSKNIGEFFDNIEYLSAPDRVVAKQETRYNEPESQVESKPVSQGDTIAQITEHKDTRDGSIWHSAGIIAKLSRPEYEKVAVIAKKHGGKYFPFTRTFLFKSKDGAEAFRNEINGQSPAQFSMDALPSTMPDVVNGFYSPLEKIIGEAKADKLPVKQWIEKFAKGDEAKWTGLTDWLSAQEGSVTKSDILNYLENNRVEIKEVVKDDTDADEIMKRLTTAEGAAREDYRTIARELGVVDEFDVYDIQRKWVYKEAGTGNIKDVPEKYIARLNKIRDDIDAYNAAVDFDDYFDPTPDEMTKYGQYTLPGEKTNYKEVLVTLPNKNEKPLDKWAYYETKGITQDNYDDLSTTEQSEIFREWSNYFDENHYLGKSKFDSNHWSEPNILTHIRMDTRIDANGEKVLFLEELQSDWSSSGRKKGFKGDTEKTTKRLQELGYDVRDGKVGRLEGDYFVRKYPLDLVGEARELAQSLEFSVPTAPFVTDVNKWTSLSLKVALKEAVKQGTTKIAWTTGSQQAERYSLSNHVDEITYSKYPDGTYQFAGSWNDTQLFNYQHIAESQLEDYVGKEIAEKIINGDGSVMSYGRAEEGTYGELGKTLSGLDLKVGGKGMVGYYGDPAQNKLGILGNVAKSMFGDVGTMQIKTDRGFDEDRKNVQWNEVDVSSTRVQAGPHDGEYVVSLEGGGLFKTFPEYFNTSKEAKAFGQQELEKAKAQSEYDSTQHSVTITPELANQVKTQGLPLFSIQAAEAAAASGNPDANGPIIIKLRDAGASLEDDMKLYADVWIGLVEKQSKPFINRGLELIKGTEYDTGNPRQDLAKAIGDKAAKSKKDNKLINWVKSFWKRVGTIMQINVSPERLAEMKIEEYLDIAATQLKYGNEIYAQLLADGARKTDTEQAPVDPVSKYDELDAEAAAIRPLSSGKPKVEKPLDPQAKYELEGRDTEATGLVMANPKGPAMLKLLESYSGAHRRVLETVALLFPTLKAAGISINIHETKDSYANAVKANGGTDNQAANSGGFYRNKEVHINLSKPSLKENTALHEAFHPIIRDLLVKDKKVFKAFLAEIMADPEMRKRYYDEFAVTNYQYLAGQEDAIGEEMLVEASADIVMQRILRNMKEMPDKLFDRILKYIKDVLGDTYGKLAEFINTKEKFADFAETLADAISKGMVVPMNPEINDNIRTIVNESIQHSKQKKSPPGMFDLFGAPQAAQTDLFGLINNQSTLEQEKATPEALKTQEEFDKEQASKKENPPLFSSHSEYEARVEKIKNELRHDILTNQDYNYGPIIDNLIRKGRLTKEDKDELLGTKETGEKLGLNPDKMLAALQNMAGLQHLHRMDEGDNIQIKNANLQEFMDNWGDNKDDDYLDKFSPSTIKDMVEQVVASGLAYPPYVIEKLREYNDPKNPVAGGPKFVIAIGIAFAELKKEAIFYDKLFKASGDIEASRQLQFIKDAQYELARLAKTNGSIAGATLGIRSKLLQLAGLTYESQMAEIEAINEGKAGKNIKITKEHEKEVNRLVNKINALQEDLDKAILAANPLKSKAVEAEKEYVRKTRSSLESRPSMSKEEALEHYRRLKGLRASFSLMLSADPGQPSMLDIINELVKIAHLEGAKGFKEAVAKVQSYAPDITEQQIYEAILSTTPLARQKSLSEYAKRQAMTRKHVKDIAKVEKMATDQALDLLRNQKVPDEAQIAEFGRLMRDIEKGIYLLDPNNELYTKWMNALQHIKDTYSLAFLNPEPSKDTDQLLGEMINAVQMLKDHKFRQWIEAEEAKLLEQKRIIEEGRISELISEDQNNDKKYPTKMNEMVFDENGEVTETIEVPFDFGKRDRQIRDAKVEIERLKAKFRKENVFAKAHSIVKSTFGSAMAMIDLSMMGIQGFKMAVTAGLRNPKLLKKAFVDSLKAFADEMKKDPGFANEVHHAITEHNYYAISQAVGLDITSPDSHHFINEMLGQDDAFDILDDKLKKNKNKALAPVKVLSGLRRKLKLASNASFGTYLNVLSMGTFAAYIDNVKRLTKDANNPAGVMPSIRELTIKANEINSATGRTRRAPGLTKGMGYVFWAPRLYLSQAQNVANIIMDPVNFAASAIKGDKELTRVYGSRAINSAIFAASSAAIYLLRVWLAKLQCGDAMSVNTNITKPSFLKINCGELTLDPTGNERQWLALGARILAAGDGEPYVDYMGRPISTLDQLWNAMQYKLNPIAAAGWRTYDAVDFLGRPEIPGDDSFGKWKSRGKVILDHLTPMAGGNVVDIAQAKGLDGPIPKGISKPMIMAEALIGLGVMRIDAEKEAARDAIEKVERKEKKAEEKKIRMGQIRTRMGNLKELQGDFVGVIPEGVKGTDHRVTYDGKAYKVFKRTDDPDGDGKDNDYVTIKTYKTGKNKGKKYFDKVDDDKTKKFK